MSAHTALPWFVEKGLAQIHQADPLREAGDVTGIARCQGALDWSGGSERPLAPETAQANAEFIVRACNAHDDLLAALKKLSADASVFLSMADPETHGYTNTAILRQRIIEARAAIEKADGKL